jgi:hypothetical protein
VTHPRTLPEQDLGATKLGVVNPAKVYICSDCHHGLILHEVDDEGQRAICCVDGCRCGYEDDPQRDWRGSA